jgi:hypothetical protein
VFQNFSFKYLNVLSVFILLLISCNNAPTGSEQTGTPGLDTGNDSTDNSLNIETYFTQPIADSSLISVETSCAVFISPTSEEIDELKKAGGEDFYISADDAIYYNAQAQALLDSLQIKIVHTDKKYLKLVKSNKKEIYLDTRASGPGWQVFFFNPLKEPLVASTADITAEDIQKYFNTN